MSFQILVVTGLKEKILSSAEKAKFKATSEYV